MAKVTHNESNAGTRSSFIRGWLKKYFNVTDGYEVLAIAYNPNVPFKSNNFIYAIQFSASSTDSDYISAAFGKLLQPGCVRLPPLTETSKFILRLANADAEGMGNSNRIENEVGLLELARKATKQAGIDVVSEVYAWRNTASSSQGWILEQYIPGVDLDTMIPSMSLKEKRAVFRQVIRVLDALQKCGLPEGVTGYGGVTYSASGEMIGAEMALVSAGPFDSFELMYRESFRAALEIADKNKYICGWHANEVRKRIEHFVKGRLTSMLAILVEDSKRCVIHGDLTSNNMLYDAETKRITALLDFDFACISHPSYEYLRSFNEQTGGKFVGYSGDDNDEKWKLRDAKLHGFPSMAVVSTAEGDNAVDWESAKLWEEELEKADVLRPSTMRGIEMVADVNALLEGVLPWRLNNADILQMQSKEVILKCRVEAEKKLDRMLQRLGC